MSMDKTPDMEGLSPAERAALYKQRRQQGATGGAATPPPSSPPVPPAAPSAPQDRSAGGAPPDLSSMTPAERAAYYKAQARAKAAGEAPPAPPVPAAAAPAAPSPAPAPSGGGAPADLSSMSPAERAAYYKAQARAKAAGAPAPEAPAAAPQPAPPAPATPPAARPAPAAAPVPAKPAAPAAPAAPTPPPQPPFVTHILDAIDGSEWQWRHGYAEIKVPRERLLDAARFLFDVGFDYLSFVTEVDWGDRFEMLYHVYSYDYERQPLGVILRTELPREGLPEVASMTAVWPGAEYMEREACEMMGIRFLGHPDLRRILLADDFVGYPMRKDYTPDFDYVTMRSLVREFDPRYR